MRKIAKLVILLIKIKKIKKSLKKKRKEALPIPAKEAEADRQIEEENINTIKKAKNIEIKAGVVVVIKTMREKANVHAEEAEVALIEKSHIQDLLQKNQI